MTTIISKTRNFTLLRKTRKSNGRTYYELRVNSYGTDISFYDFVAKCEKTVGKVSAVEYTGLFKFTKKQTAIDTFTLLTLKFS